MAKQIKEAVGTALATQLREGVADGLALLDSMATDATALAAMAAQEAADLVVGAPTIGTRGGVFSVGGNEIGAKIRVLILASTPVNVFYDGAFDPEIKTAPLCWSVAPVDDRGVPAARETMCPMGPESNHQSKDCAHCALNEFGSAENGRGKACRNAQRCLVLPLPGDGEELSAPIIEAIPPMLLSIPPTSLRAFGWYAKGIVAQYKLPAFAVATSIVATASGKRGGFVLEFEQDSKPLTALFGSILAKRGEGLELLRTRFPDPREVVARKPRVSKGKPAAK